MNDLFKFPIGDTWVGLDCKPFVIAEVAQAHDGSLRLAHSFIDAAKQAGADCVKFQLHLPEFESTLNEKFRVNMGGQDKDRFSYWERTNFSLGGWRELISHARQNEIEFLCSTFSVEGVEILRDLGVQAWKLSSGEMWSSELIESMIEDGTPIIASTGLASMADIESFVDQFRRRSSAFALLQCTSKYPTPIEESGINLISEFRQFGCAVGLSDHSGTVFPSLAAMAANADIIEVHVTFDRGMWGPDASSSLTFEELTLLCQSRDSFDLMRKKPLDKNEVASELEITKKLFSKSLALRTDLVAETVVEEKMLTLKKPGGGIPREAISRVVGKKLKRDVASRRLLEWDDLI